MQIIQTNYLQQPEKFVATEKRYDNKISHKPIFSYIGLYST